MNTTTIFVKISPRDAIKHACQCGWQRIDVDLSVYSDAEREVLAGLVQVEVEKGLRLYAPIAPATSEALYEYVCQLMTQKQAQYAADVTAIQAAIAQLRNGPIQDIKRGGYLCDVLNYSPDLLDRKIRALRTLGQPFIEEFGDVRLTAEHLGRQDEYRVWQAEQDELDRQRKVKDEVEKQRSAEAERQRIAREKSDFEAVLSAVPEPLRARFEAGFALSEELRETYKKMLLAELDLERDTTASEKLLTELTDYEFAKLLEVRKRFEGNDTVLAVDPYLVWNYRKATEDDDESEIYHDGDVRCDQERIVQVKLSRHGVMTLAKIPF